MVELLSLEGSTGFFTHPGSTSHTWYSIWKKNPLIGVYGPFNGPFGAVHGIKLSMFRGRPLAFRSRKLVVYGCATVYRLLSIFMVSPKDNESYTTTIVRP